MSAIRISGNDVFIVVNTKNGELRANIDAEDASRLKDFSWYWLARHRRLCAKHNGRTIQLGRTVLGLTSKLVADHINGNTLDNRKENLRAITRQQNGTNTLGWAGRELPRGVTRQTRRANVYFRVQHRLFRKQISAGYFSTVEAADAAAIAWRAIHMPHTRERAV